MGTDRCCAINCKNSKASNRNLTFFPFPSINSHRIWEWIVNLGRIDLLSEEPMDLCKSYAVCADHFESFCFYRDCRLHPDAVPTKFNHCLRGPDSDVSNRLTTGTAATRNSNAEKQDQVCSKGDDHPKGLHNYSSCEEVFVLSNEENYLKQKEKYLMEPHYPNHFLYKKRESEMKNIQKNQKEKQDVAHCHGQYKEETDIENLPCNGQTVEKTKMIKLYLSTSGHYKCNYCTESFLTLHELLAHELHKHVESSVKTNNERRESAEENNSQNIPLPHVATSIQYKREHCMEKFHTLHSLVAHELRQHIESSGTSQKRTNVENMSSCDYSLEENNTKSVLSTPEYRCKHCNANFLTIHKLFAHELAQHIGFVGTQGKLSCHICTEIFDSEKDLLKHKEDLHCKSIFTSSGPSSQTARITSYTCGLCEKAFSTAHELLSHELQNHIEPSVEISSPSFDCRLCDAFFSSENDLSNHELQAHYRENTEADHSLLHICYSCNEVFVLKNDLRDHKLQMHCENQPSGTCDTEHSQMKDVLSQNTRCEDKIVQNLIKRSQLPVQKKDLHSNKIHNEDFSSEKDLLQHGKLLHGENSQRRVQSTEPVDEQIIGVPLQSAYNCGVVQDSVKYQLCKKKTNISCQKFDIPTGILYECQECEEKLPNSLKLFEHELKYHVVQPFRISQAECMPPCHLCNNVFYSRHQILFHEMFVPYKNMLLETDAVQNSEMESNENPYLETSKKSPTSTLPCMYKYECYKCKILFDTENNLLKHVEEIHDKSLMKEVRDLEKEGNKGYKCSVCQIFFRSVQSFLCHKLLRHDCDSDSENYLFRDIEQEIDNIEQSNYSIEQSSYSIETTSNEISTSNVRHDCDSDNENYLFRDIKQQIDNMEQDNDRMETCALNKISMSNVRQNSDAENEKYPFRSTEQKINSKQNNDNLESSISNQVSASIINKEIQKNICIDSEKDKVVKRYVCLGCKKGYCSENELCQHELVSHCQKIELSKLLKVHSGLVSIKAAELENQTHYNKNQKAICQGEEKGMKRTTEAIHDEQPPEKKNR